LDKRSEKGKGQLPFRGKFVIKDRGSGGKDWGGQPQSFDRKILKKLKSKGRIKHMGDHCRRNRIISRLTGRRKRADYRLKWTPSSVGQVKDEEITGTWPEGCTGRAQRNGMSVPKTS